MNGRPPATAQQLSTKNGEEHSGDRRSAFASTAVQWATEVCSGRLLVARRRGDYLIALVRPSFGHLDIVYAGHDIHVYHVLYKSGVSCQIVS